jgi:hypothetical protein
LQQEKPGGNAPRALIRPVNGVVIAEAGSREERRLRGALDVITSRIALPGPWVSLALAYEPPAEAPGDCYYVPPACLLDLDLLDGPAARGWALHVGWLTHLDDDRPFQHCWLQTADLVVSVSNLRRGYPAYAMTRGEYERRNRIRGLPRVISARALRIAAARQSLGPSLARWIAGSDGPPSRGGGAA